MIRAINSMAAGGVLLSLSIFCTAVFAQEIIREGRALTPISDVPWTPIAPGPAPKVVYGTDDRIDVYQEANPERLEWAASTCGLIDKARMTENPDGSWDINPSAYLRFGGIPACAGEPFGDQPTAPHCTGFLVGPDLIVTAGHCFYTSDLPPNDRWLFVFGFEMLDALTPRLHLEKERVYRAVSIVSTSPGGSLDHTILKLDRPVVSPGAHPFQIRRQGVVGVGERVGIIGHPAGLPLKLAFGDQTAVRSNTDSGFFVANTDSYAGNSGSPVINQVTGFIEGILVRGEVDYINMGSCFVSNAVSNAGGRGEDCTKISRFASDIPVVISSAGVVQLSRDYYSCNSPLDITLFDLDLAGTGLASIDITTSSGDSETVALAEVNGTPGRFEASVPIQGFPAIPSNGVVNGANGDIVTVVYHDADDGRGNIATFTVTTQLDCIDPVIKYLNSGTLGTQAFIIFDTNEPTAATVNYGTSCAEANTVVSDPMATHHSITISGLQLQTDYYFTVNVHDKALNTTSSDQGGACHTFSTGLLNDYQTEAFSPNNAADLAYTSLFFYNWGGNLVKCLDRINNLPVDPSDGDLLSLGDNDYVEVPLLNTKTMPFFGINYDRIYVGSNGYVTFGKGDTESLAMAANHFLLPRVSGYFCDLNPAVRGQVRVQQLTDRVVVTYLDVPAVDPAGYPPPNFHTFQIELFFGGSIRLTWRDLFKTDAAVVGLSPGGGAPADFISNDFSKIFSCSIIDSSRGGIHSADTNGDRVIDLSELLRVIQLYNLNGYSCDSAGEDGFRPGPGNTSCTKHSADYNPPDWIMGLSELLRVIQFFNAGGYVYDPLSEDTFRPKSNNG